MVQEGEIVTLIECRPLAADSAGTAGRARSTQPERHRRRAVTAAQKTQRADQNEHGPVEMRLSAHDNVALSIEPR